jgi:hypothetical protein
MGLLSERSVGDDSGDSADFGAAGIYPGMILKRDGPADLASAIVYACQCRRLFVAPILLVGFGGKE